MILTEEQRDAIEYAISTLEQCGYEPEDLVVVKILQAMIDSSGTVGPAGGFDLERARGLRDFLQDDCAEVGDVWAEMIAEIERLRAALDESERVVAHKTKSAAHWYDEHLQARADRVQTRRVVEQQAARIKELEDAHKRSGAKYAKIINELRSSVYANMPGLKKQWDEILNAPANGKIGPDDSKKISHLRPYEVVAADLAGMLAKSWQITDERKAAIRDAEIALRDAVLDSNDPHCWDAETAVLRGMLEEVA